MSVITAHADISPPVHEACGEGEAAGASPRRCCAEASERIIVAQLEMRRAMSVREKAMGRV
ncbi:MAG: hypothetical protein VX475_06445, partial [Myxococcota bacterium]|nr:hypothetical protein [Myxococcota bacterium]